LSQTDGNSSHALGGLAATALQIAEERAKILAEMKAAILAKDDKLALRFAKRLCGVDDEESEGAN
jgi:hypothetical protein